jgi:hypothetical protein
MLFLHDGILPLVTASMGLSLSEFIPNKGGNRILRRHPGRSPQDGNSTLVQGHGNTMTQSAADKGINPM